MKASGSKLSWAVRLTWAEAGAHHGMLDLLALSDDPRAREAEQAIGAAVVICPGGGYGGLAIDKEGHDVARWLDGDRVPPPAQRRWHAVKLLVRSRGGGDQRAAAGIE